MADEPGDPAHGAAEWRRVDALLTELLELPEQARAARLAAQCAGDEALRVAVERLLSAERRSAGAFESASAGLDRLLGDGLEGETQDADAVPDNLSRLGPYRVVRLLGRGGMALVWLAERADGQFEKQVAIKVLRQWIEGQDGVRRFVAERQILSSLAHPNIAPLLDGGTTADGTPWLATEYIDGEPITGYCESRQLGVEARLGLFLQVADAVQHAHQKLVVHRDLKPSNILVDREGRVRLLDFGIAKLLDPEAAAGHGPVTSAAYRPMTPEYAAPEQLGRGSITTLTDIYQLGVLLYELLSGQRPPLLGNEAAPSGNTPPPSTVVRRGAGATDRQTPADRRAALQLAKRLEGDLDLIVLKALQEDPARRYTSAAALAGDLRSHLAGQAITARPESSLDAARRFFRRRPWAAVALALAVGLVITLQVSAVRFSQQRDAAQREAERVTQVKDLLLGLFQRANPWTDEALRGRETTIWESVEAATDKVRAELHGDPVLRAELLGVLADLQFSAGNMDASVELLEEVVELHRANAGRQSAPYAVALAQLGRQRMMLGRQEAALAAVDAAEPIARRLPDGDASARVVALLAIGDVRHAYGAPGEAEALMREAQSLIDAGAEVGLVTRVNTANNLAQVLAGSGKISESEDIARATIATIERELGSDHVSLFVPLSVVGNAQRLLDRPTEAIPTLERGLAILVREYGDRFESTINMRNNLALALAGAGQHERAVTEMSALVAQQRAALGDAHPWIGNGLQNLSVMLVLDGRLDEALEVLEEARASYAAALPAGHVRHAFPLLTKSFIHLRRGEADVAAAAAGQSLEMMRDALPDTHFAVGVAKCLAGEAWLAQGRREEAALLLATALPIAESGPNHMLPYVPNCRAAHAAADSAPSS